MLLSYLSVFHDLLQTVHVLRARARRRADANDLTATQQTLPMPWQAFRTLDRHSTNITHALAGLSHTQAKTQMALWSIMAAPLMMGNDLR